MMVSQLKKNYTANKIASSIFVVGGIQTPILDITYHKKSPKRLLLLVPRYIALIQFCLKMMHWTVSHT